MASSSKFLLDTSTFIWSADDSPRLSKAARQALATGTNELVVSLASIWELQIKHASGKLTLPCQADELARAFAKTSNSRLLDISVDHVRQLYRLPAIHKDPFDRMLIAQALVEKLTIITPDTALGAYAINVLW